MPRNLKRYQQTGGFHFITFSCYRRRPLLQNERRRYAFLGELERARKRFRFLVIGFVVMPEHVHLLVSEPEAGTLAKAIQVIKQNTSRTFQKLKKPHPELFLPQETRSPFWQTRYYDFNVHNARKRIEKLQYMHRNPVKRGLCARPEDWLSSSARWYLLDEVGLVQINQGEKAVAERV